jgi:hypothetical protein
MVLRVLLILQSKNWMKNNQSIYAGLAQENGFGEKSITVLLAVAVKGAAVLCTSRKECNKYDLIEARCF